MDSQSPELLHQHGMADRFGVTRKKADNLSGAISRLTTKEVNLKIPDEEVFLIYAPAIVAIAHRIDTNSQEPYPLTSKQIAEMSFTAKAVLKISGIFGQRGKDFTSHQIENIAAKKIDRYAHRIDDFLKNIEGVQNPKAEFMKEIQIIHNLVTYNHATLQDVFQAILRTQSMQDGDGNTQPLQDSFPLLRALTKVAGISLNNPQVNSLIGQINIVTPEVLNAIKGFLSHYHQDYGYDTKKVGGIKRMLAEEYKGDDLARVQQQVPYVLDGVYQFLPDHGKTFAQGVRMQMELLAKSDKTPQETLKIHGWV